MPINIVNDITPHKSKNKKAKSVQNRKKVSSVKKTARRTEAQFKVKVNGKEVMNIELVGNNENGNFYFNLKTE